MLLSAKVNYEADDNILQYFGPFLLLFLLWVVLMVTLKWSVLTTSRRHNLGSTEATLATYQCIERLSYFQVNLYPSCPLLYNSAGGIVALP